ncbi:DNA-binding domain superfamily [Sesbania bispinosa]|nr:DNA-binding domain superfamily [Sesbania bispinosa]
MAVLRDNGQQCEQPKEQQLQGDQSTTTTTGLTIMKKLLQELMIWLRSSTGEHQLSQNFPVSDYEKEIKIMITVTKEEYLASLRRRSSGFSRGVSKYRGVARPHHNGKWKARIGRVFGNKYLYLGTYSTQEEAARAYDIAAIEHRGINAVTNSDLRTYIRSLRPSAHSTASQNQKPSIDNQPFTTPNLIQTRETTKVSNFNFHPFPGGELDNNKKQEISQYMTPLSRGNKSASSTALGLLLKSSVFRELVQRNLNFVNEETEMKNTQEGTDDGVRVPLTYAIPIATAYLTWSRQKRAHCHCITVPCNSPMERYFKSF